MSATRERLQAGGGTAGGGRRPRHRDRAARGQAVLEFALVAPVLLAIALGVVDFGRVYASAVTIEAAAREAADYASWHLSEQAWQDEATRRACSAALVLDGYAGAADGTSCTNPTVELFTDETTDAGVTLAHARLTYDFRTSLQLRLFPSGIVIVRDSRFAKH